MTAHIPSANYLDETVSELDNNARLALDLILYLRNTQNFPDGCWGDGQINTTLRQTTQALEALHLLDWPVLATAMEAGSNWLINLSDEEEVDTEDGNSIRRHPSRFKTLALVGELEHGNIYTEYESLLSRIEDDGILHGILPDSNLATMIIVDSLAYAQNPELQTRWQATRKRCVDAVEKILTEQQETYADHSGRNAQDLPLVENNISYGLDILLNEGRLTAGNTLAVDIRDRMIASVSQDHYPTPLPTEILYAALQLATHFREEPQTIAALRTFYTNIKYKYTQKNFNRESTSLHPLLLRVMMKADRETLVPAMIRLMLENEDKSRSNLQQAEAQQHQAAFQQLILRRCQIHIKKTTPLVGGLSVADLFKIEYDITMKVYEDGRVKGMPLQAAPSLIVKVGRYDALGLAVEKYQSIPGNVQQYFAKHATNHDIFSDHPDSPSYLVLEDLTDEFDTLHNRLQTYEKRHLTDYHKENIRGYIDAVANTLLDIYRRTLQMDSMVGSQTARLYFSRFEARLMECVQPDRFPVIKSWFGGFHVNGRRYKSIEYYLQQLDRYKERLQIRQLMLIHGDAHGRNVMVDEQYNVKLIDIDKVNFSGDYIYDFAELIEDVAVFRFLFERDHSSKIHESVEFPNAGDDPGVIEAAVNYPLFSSEMAIYIQRLLIERLEYFSAEIDDEFWKERLWMAISLHLVRLIPKQRDQSIAGVLYAETVKLLNQLVNHLQQKRPLPELPFLGNESPYPAIPDTLLSSTIHGAVSELHHAILGLDGRIGVEKDKSNGTRAIYYMSGHRAPFAILIGTETGGRILLACEPDKIRPILPDVQARSSSSVMQTMLVLTHNEDRNSILKAIQQVIRNGGE